MVQADMTDTLLQMIEQARGEGRHFLAWLLLLAHDEASGG